MNWVYKSFKELSTEELYAILRLRAEVFIVEQNCPYQDLDYKDQKSYHLLGWEGDLLSAYTRILPAGVSFEEASIGRVVTSPQTRRGGYGRRLMLESIERLHSQYGKVPIRIGAQYYLKSFYVSLGFLQVSDIYLEDGIEHIEMLMSS